MQTRTSWAHGVPAPKLVLAMSTRPRGRPREYAPDAAIDAILRTFWVNGFEATSLDDLSAATGMKRPSIYRAFGNKEQLYGLALAHYRRVFAETVGVRFVSERRLRSALTFGFDAAINFFSCGSPRARGCFELVTGLDVSGRYPAIQTALAEGAKSRLKFARELLVRAGEHGELDGRLDIGSRALLLRSTIESLAINARLGGSPATLQNLAEASTHLICNPD